MSPATRPRPPVVVVAYGLITAVLFSYNLSRNGDRFWDRWLFAAAVIVVAVLLLAAVVVWRRRWAWWLVVVFGAVSLAEPSWKWRRFVAYLSQLVILGLLLSPDMRQYLGVDWRRHRDRST